MVTVAQMSGGLGGGVLITTNRPHCVGQRDIVLGENGLMVAEVQEVVAPTQIVVDVKGGNLEIGQHLEVEREEEELPTLEQEVERLTEEEEMESSPNHRAEHAAVPRTHTRHRIMSSG